VAGSWTSWAGIVAGAGVAMVSLRRRMNLPCATASPAPSQSPLIRIPRTSGRRRSFGECTNITYSKTAASQAATRDRRKDGASSNATPRVARAMELLFSSPAKDRAECVEGSRGLWLRKLHSPADSKNEEGPRPVAESDQTIKPLGCSGRVLSNSPGVVAGFGKPEILLTVLLTVGGRKLERTGRCDQTRQAVGCAAWRRYVEWPEQDWEFSLPLRLSRQSGAQQGDLPSPLTVLPRPPHLHFLPPVFSLDCD
jgi:hypothetical protein